MSEGEKGSDTNVLALELENFPKEHQARVKELQDGFNVALQNYRATNFVINVLRNKQDTKYNRDNLKVLRKSRLEWVAVIKVLKKEFKQFGVEITVDNLISVWDRYDSIG